METEWPRMTVESLKDCNKKHLAQLAQSVASARELAGKLPQDLHWSEEIALVFRLPRPGDTKR